MITCTKCNGKGKVYWEGELLRCPTCNGTGLTRGYWDNVCDIQKKQTEKGISTYGQTLEQNESLSPVERLTYLEEELIDGLMYIEHIKAMFEDEKKHGKAYGEYMECNNSYTDELDSTLMCGENHKMKIKSGMEEKYKAWFDKNTDSYSRRCFTYAEDWARMMEQEIESNPEIPAYMVISICADKYSHAADTDGITGFMHGAAVSILTQCWIYGEELAAWDGK